MSEEKFTPGPWEVYCQGIYAVDGETIGYACGVDDGIVNANAALISAAPDMYELLDFLRKDGEICENYVFAIEYVLQKARGEEC